MKRPVIIGIVGGNMYQFTKPFYLYVSMDIHTCLKDALPPALEDAITLKHRIGDTLLPLLTQL